MHIYILPFIIPNILIPRGGKKRSLHDMYLEIVTWIFDMDKVVSVYDS